MANNDRDSLMKKIQELSFVKTETELYLDGHPYNTAALGYYREILAKLDEALTKYQNEYGPVFAEGVVGDRWTWIEGKWPWQIDIDEKMEDK